MAWKAPFRPRTDNGVTQGYNDGLVMIYSVTDSAAPGYEPKPQLTKKLALRYEERSLGIRRYYEAMQNQISVERVVRCPRVAGVTNQDVAQTEDGTYYRIDLVQAVTDVYPPSMDLTLAKYIQNPEVIV